MVTAPAVATGAVAAMVLHEKIIANAKAMNPIFLMIADRNIVILSPIVAM